jgi:cytosine/adenosine deaminase-related metal-dependent hydrolase
MSRQTLYRACYVLPIISSLVEDGAVLVESGLIRKVGHYRDLADAYPEATLVDFGASVLLPPMVNAHAHLELTAFPDWAAAAGEPDPPQTFVDWILWLVRIRRDISEEQLKASIAAGLKASLLFGTGAVGDIFTILPAVEAYLGSPLYGQVFAEVLGHDLGVIEKRLSSIKSLTVKPPAKKLNWGLSPHATYTLSASATDLVFAFAKELTLRCTIHLAESEAESDFLRDGTGAIADKLFSSAKWDPLRSPPPGCSPVRSLCSEGRLKEGDLVVHGVHVGTADIQRLKQIGCSVALCPRSNAALNVGKAPVTEYLNGGIPLALGTDSLASSDSLSLWDELAFAVEWFAGAAEPRDWLEIATLGGAKALGIEKRMGQLSPGQEASFQVVTLPSLPQVDTLEETLCASGKDVNVTHLYLAGENVLL